MGCSKFIYNGVTKFDLTADTVDAAHLSSGYTAHGADGEAITGTLIPEITRLYSGELTDTYNSSTAEAVVTLSLGSSAYTSTGILYVKIRDKTGRQNGYYYGTDAFIFNRYPAQEATTAAINSGAAYGYNINVYRTTSTGAFASYGTTSTGYGLYPYQLTSAGKLTIRHRYSADYSLTINGTYTIEVYLIKGPFSNWYGTASS